MEWLAYVKSVKADVGKRELTLSFTVSLDEENLAAAQELAFYANPDAGAIDLKVLPRQTSMFKNSVSVTLTKKTGPGWDGVKGNHDAEDE